MKTYRFYVEVTTDESRVSAPLIKFAIDDAVARGEIANANVEDVSVWPMQRRPTLQRA